MKANYVAKQQKLIAKAVEKARDAAQNGRRGCGAWKTPPAEKETNGEFRSGGEGALDVMDKTSVSCNELLPPATVATESASPERRNSPLPPAALTEFGDWVQSVCDEARRRKGIAWIKKDGIQSRACSRIIAALTEEWRRAIAANNRRAAGGNDQDQVPHGPKGLTQ